MAEELFLTEAHNIPVGVYSGTLFSLIHSPLYGAVPHEAMLFALEYGTSSLATLERACLVADALVRRKPPHFVRVTLHNDILVREWLLPGTTQHDAILKHLLVILMDKIQE